VGDRKVCSKCRWEKHVSEFGKNNSKRDRLNTWCNTCKSEYFKQHYVKKKYNRTLEETEQILIDQTRECASDGTPINMKTRKMHHNKETGQIYDLLCHSCNMVLGYAHHDYRVILMCAIYQAKLNNIDFGEFIDFLKSKF